MKHKDYPALYVAANRLAERYQRIYLGTLVAQGLILMLIAATAFVAPDHNVFTLVALFFLLLVGLALFLMVLRPDQVWYGARAVAESVKTMTWRYMCCAPPFSDSSEVAEQLFFNRLREVLHQNGLVSSRLDAAGTNSPLTITMREKRDSTIEAKVSFYEVHRINDQCEWYTNKSRAARREGIWSYAILILVCMIGLVLGVLKTDATSTSRGIAALGLITTICAFLMTWIQAKRYLELSAAYAVSSHEIALLAPMLKRVKSQRGFEEFVTEAENAFSREHTQWTARRDT